MNEKEIINNLFLINQVDRAKNGYFEFMSKKNKTLIKKELGDGNLISFDIELFSRLANEILESNLNALKTFKNYYLVFVFSLNFMKFINFRNILKKAKLVSRNSAFGSQKNVRIFIMRLNHQFSFKTIWRILVIFLIQLYYLMYIFSGLY